MTVNQNGLFSIRTLIWSSDLIARLSKFWFCKINTWVRIKNGDMNFVHNGQVFFETSNLLWGCLKTKRCFQVSLFLLNSSEVFQNWSIFQVQIVLLHEKKANSSTPSSCPLPSIFSSPSYARHCIEHNNPQMDMVSSPTTSLHSSGMRTTRALTISRGGGAVLSPRGVYLVPVGFT